MQFEPPAGLPPRVELRAVPFFPQTPFHCGPAALATVLVHAGFDTTPERLADAVFLPDREGSLQVEMLAAARRAGALAVPLPPDLGALWQEVAAGTPVVVLQNLGLAIAPRWHYAVAVGYDLVAREAVLRSGTTERELEPFALFDRTWARSGRWAFAALPPGRLPSTAREVDATQAAVAFERSASPAAALRAYDSVLARWPDNAAAGMGQGNVRAALGEWAGAAASFERVATRHDMAAAWHNLALARWQLGQRDAARRAAAKALERAQGSEPQWLDASRRLQALVAER
ncbi:MAG TPA: PA2778 family cysteine peptidase [Burkholderiaceae bacterium]|nr:PA2778 family cysteine peptidase [Burkholderiaceae bacterium]